MVYRLIALTNLYISHCENNIVMILIAGYRLHTFHIIIRKFAWYKYIIIIIMALIDAYNIIQCYTDII